MSKDDLLDAVWGTRFVSEGVVKSVVAELRTALADDPKAPRWIQTVSRRGYRFIGEVHAAVAGAPLETAPPAEVRPGNLPAVVPRLVGRRRELQRLHDEALGLVVDTPLLGFRAGLVEEGRRACETVRSHAAATNDERLRLGWALAVALLGLYGSAYPAAQSLHAAQTAADGFEALGESARAYVALYLCYLLGLRQLEDRHDDAARLLGWAEGATRAAVSGKAGATVTQAGQRLRARLEQAMGGAALPEACRAGASLEQCDAENLALRLRPQ